MNTQDQTPKFDYDAWLAGASLEELQRVTARLEELVTRLFERRIEAAQRGGADVIGRHLPPNMN
jgi:hypothetical protein